MNQLTNQLINQSTKPLIPFGWLRALLFFVFFFLVVMLVQWGTGEFLNILQKAETGKDKPISQILNGDIFLIVFVSSISAFISVWIFRTFIDRQTVWSLGFKWQGFAGHAWTGLFASLFMLGAGSLLLVAMKYLSFTGVQFNAATIAINMGMMMLVAFSEELLFRGYLLHNLMQSVNKWIALAVSALLFVFVHTGNPGVQDSVLPMIELFIGGLMLGINYIYTKNLWFGILLHFGWNFFMGPVLGYEVSGINMQSVLQQNISGPELWTGGAFGFEGSVLSMIFNLAVMLLLVWVYERKNTEKFHSKNLLLENPYFEA